MTHPLLYLQVAGARAEYQRAPSRQLRLYRVCLPASQGRQAAPPLLDVGFGLALKAAMAANPPLPKLPGYTVNLPVS